MFFLNLMSSALLLTLAANVSAIQAPRTPPWHPSNIACRGLLRSNEGVPNVNATFDYVFIGGGNAGPTLAARLSETQSVRVAVIEAGAFYEGGNRSALVIPAEDILWTGKAFNDINPLVDWGFSTTPQAGSNNQILHYARGKTLGGCTARKYMAYQRGTVDAYQKRVDEVGDQSKFLPLFYYI